MVLKDHVRILRCSVNCRHPKSILPSTRMDELPETLAQISLRRHRLELALFQLLPTPCRKGLAAATPESGCNHCRHMIDRTFLDPAQPDDQAVDEALYHLTNLDGCDGAHALRCAEADRALRRDEGKANGISAAGV